MKDDLDKQGSTETAICCYESDMAVIVMRRHIGIHILHPVYTRQEELRSFTFSLVKKRLQEVIGQ